MKFLKLYEQFTKDVLKKPEFNDEKTAYIDSKGVIHIKNWNLY